MTKLFLSTEIWDIGSSMGCIHHSIVKPQYHIIWMWLRFPWSASNSIIVQTCRKKLCGQKRKQCKEFDATKWKDHTVAIYSLTLPVSLRRTYSNTCGAPGPPMPSKWVGIALERKPVLGSRRRSQPQAEKLQSNAKAFLSKSNIRFKLLTFLVMTKKTWFITQKEVANPWGHPKIRNIARLHKASSLVKGNRW